MYIFCPEYNLFTVNATSVKKISLFLLVLLVVSAIDSIRNLPAAALFGSSLIFFFLFGAVVFLIPVALISAELSAAFPTQGGVYHWVRLAFGEKIGLLAIWLQWINTMVWYPTILAFIAGTAAYLIQPDLVNNRLYLLTVVLSVFWAMTALNLFGLKVSTLVNSACGSIGTLLPLLLLILLGTVWFFSGQPLQIDFQWDSIIPSLSHAENWVSLTAIMASFLGMELAGVHVNDIENPQRNFPRAMLYSVFLLLFTMLFGSLAIAAVVPADEINLVSGIMQVFCYFFNLFRMGWAVPILTILILVGTVGSMINWLISPAKGLLHAAEFGFLPLFFMRKNRHGVAHNVLIAQGVLVTLFCLALFLVPSVNAFYWFLTDLSTELYILMYLLLFGAALKLKNHPDRRVNFKIPGGSVGIWITALLGCGGCLITLLVGLFPPEHIGMNSIMQYSLMVVLGMLAAIAPVFALLIFRRKPTY